MHDVLHPLIAALFIVAGAALFSIDFQSIVNAIAIATTTETLAAAGFALSLPSGNGKAAVKLWCAVTAGAGTTALVVNVYAGGAIAGSPIATFTNTIPAASGNPQYNLSHALGVWLNNTTQAQYCFSVTQTGATGNGSITAASIETELLSG